MKSSIKILIILAIIGFILYYPGLQSKPYNDDYHLFSKPAEFKPHQSFYQQTPHVYFYRPLEKFLIWNYHNIFGINTLAVHITALSLHILLSYMIYYVMTMIGLSRQESQLAVLIFLTSQSNVSAVVDIDSISQLLSTFFGCAARLFTIKFFISKKRRNNFKGEINDKYLIWYWLSALCFFLSLLSKESGFSFLAMIFLLLTITYMRKDRILRSLAKISFVFTPYLLLSLIYFILRTIAGYSIITPESNTYSFSISSNVIVNALSLGFSCLQPFSSVSVYIAIVENELTEMFFASAIPFFY